MSLTPGTRLGPYEIVAAIGAGGMGEVYRGRDTRLDRTVAIKVLPADLAADPQFRARFDQEARTISQFSHPHICTLHDVGDVDGTAFLVMELLQGQSLADRLKKGALPIEEALKIAIDVADALRAAHKHGIVHRDLKPANIMLTKAGAKLLDFGLAKLRGPAVRISMTAIEQATTTGGPNTASGTILGTVHYMAPEQVEGRDADARSDIWALGVVIYEMATRTRPFDGESAASVIGAILKNVPATISSRQPLFPPALDHVVERCLDKDPDERWQDAGDVKRELLWITSSRTTAGSPSAARVRRSTVPWLIAAAALIVAGLTFVGMFRQNGASERGGRMVLSITPPEGVKFGGPVMLAPDGQRLTFVGIGSDGRQALWVRDLNQPITRELQGTEGATFPFWSPGSDAIGFFAEKKLKTIVLGSGAIRTLAPVENSRGGAWGKDGTILFAPDAGTPIFRVSENGRDGSSPLTSLRGTEISHRWPVFLNDRQFVFTTQAGSDLTGIYLASLDSPQPVRLSPAYSNAAFIRDYLLFAENGMITAHRLDLAAARLVGKPIEVTGPVTKASGLGLLGFSVASNGLLTFLSGQAPITTAFEWWDRRGEPPVPFGSGADTPSVSETFGQNVSPDGQMLAVTVVPLATSNLWIGGMTADRLAPFTLGEHFTNNYPVWSPDSHELVYGSTRGGPFNLYKKSVVASGEERLLFKSPLNNFPTDWNRDVVVFTSQDPQTGLDIWTLLADGSQPKPWLATPYNEYAARISPDGRWIAYASDRGGGRTEIYLLPFPSGGNPTKVSRDGGTEPQWSNSGNDLFYLNDQRKLVSAKIANGQVGMITPLFETPVDSSLGSINASHYTVSRDGQRFLVNVRVPLEQRMMMLLNWSDILPTGNSAK